MEYSNEVVEESAIHVSKIFKAMEYLSVTTTSTATYNQAVFPNYTIQNFDTVATDARFLSRSPLVIYSPVVTADERDGWEQYAYDNQGSIETDPPGQAIPGKIHNLTGPLPTSDPGPFTPIWQVSPPQISALTNLNMRSSEAFDRLENFVGDRGTAALSQVIAPDEYTFYEGTAFSLMSNLTLSPQSLLLQPIFSNFTVLLAVAGGTTPPIAGYFSSILIWEIIFARILPMSAKGIIVVLSDSCGRGYTYELIGPNVIYMGEGDLHDPLYDGMVVTSTIVDSSKVVDNCHYELFIYPSSPFEQMYHTNKPGLYTAVVVIIVMGTAMFFACVDYINQRKEQMLLTKAERTHAIVTS